MRLVYSIGTVLAVLAAAWLGVRVATQASMVFRRRLAVVSLILAATITASDWPSNWLAGFWGEHTVLSGLLVSALILGSGFLALDVRAERQRLEREERVTSIGREALEVACAGAAYEVSEELAQAGYEGPESPEPTAVPLELLLNDRQICEQLSLALRRDVERIQVAYSTWAPLLASTKAINVLDRVADLLRKLGDLRFAFHHLSLDPSELSDHYRLLDYEEMQLTPESSGRRIRQLVEELGLRKNLGYVVEWSNSTDRGPR